MRDLKKLILEVLAGGDELRAEQIGKAIGSSKIHAYKLLLYLIDTGRVERVRMRRKKKQRGGNVTYLYRLAGEAPKPRATSERTPPPYRNLRLTENLQGYDHWLRDFAALCMLVRR